MSTRIQIMKPMRVFRVCPENAECIMATGGFRAAGEALLYGSLVNKRWSDRDRLVIPLLAANEGQFLLAEDVDVAARAMVHDWQREYFIATNEDAQGLVRSKAWEEVAKIRANMESHLKTYAPKSHLALVR